MPDTPTRSAFQRLAALFRRNGGDEGLGSAVSAQRAIELVREGAAMLDVRERSEWNTGHAPQALHVPLGDIAKAPGRLKQDRPVVVVCASGMRSRTAAKHLRDQGFEAASISGGMAAWRNAGGSVR